MHTKKRTLSLDPLVGMQFCLALCIYANTGQGNGLLERAPVVLSSKIYATGEMKRVQLSFSRRTAVWRSGETLSDSSVIQNWVMADKRG